jgi:hypothetical protein
MEGKMDKDFKDIPLSESQVSLKLAEIQRRCSELLQESGDSLELSLEEPLARPDDNNPYNHG